MALNAAEYLQTDDLTILLALISATLFLLNNLYKPQPLVHPILLGRQSEAGRSRKPKESAIYRNYNTGLLGRVSTIYLGRSLISVLIFDPVPAEAVKRCSYHR